MKKAKEEFTVINLPMGRECVILEGKGKHYFNAMLLAGGNELKFVKYIILELALIDGVLLTENEIDNMHIRDTNAISEVISLMMSNEFGIG